MPNRTEIVVVGSHAPGIFMRVKRPPSPGETVIGWDYAEPVDGGKGSNQAIAAARLGAQVSFVGCLGQDRLGDQGERWMAEAGVDTRFIRRSSLSTGVGFIMLDESGVPAMATSMGANEELTQVEVHTAIDQLNGRVLLTQFEISPEVAIDAARYARRRGMLTIINPAPAQLVPLGELEAADVLTPNETEARQLLRLDEREALDDISMALRLRQNTKAGCVLVTLGQRGIVGVDGEGSWSVPAPEVETVDTSGAGDVFCAALALGLVRGQPVRQASAWACNVAALSVTRPGTIPGFPTQEQVEDFLADLKTWR